MTEKDDLAREQIDVIQRSATRGLHADPETTIALCDMALASLTAAARIAAVRPASPAKVDDEIVERVARAIFFEQRNIMHDHDENWKKAHQNVWKDSARAALAALTVMER